MSFRLLALGRCALLPRKVQTHCLNVNGPENKSSHFVYCSSTYLAQMTSGSSSRKQLPAKCQRILIPDLIAATLWKYLFTREYNEKLENSWTFERYQFLEADLSILKNNCKMTSSYRTCYRKLHLFAMFEVQGLNAIDFRWLITVHKA